MSMTLEEAIVHAEDTAKSAIVCECRDEHRQLAEWLKELQEKRKQSEQKTAIWIIRKWGDDAKCSNCGHTFKDVYDMDNHDKFCRFCGRKMVGVKGEII